MNGERATNTRHLQIVETRTLGPNRSLALVRVGARAVLIGVTAERITQLMEIEDAAEVDRLIQPPVEPQGRSFRSLMSQLPGSLARMTTPASRQERADAREPKARATFGSLAASIGGFVQRLSGIEQRSQAQRPQAQRPQQPTRATRPAPPQAAAAAPVLRSTPALPADGGLFDATPDASRALRAKSGYRDSQISELQRAIAAARSGLGLDGADGRPGR
jgi:flagellar biogenesis protein FliO